MFLRERARSRRTVSSRRCVESPLRAALSRSSSPSSMRLRSSSNRAISFHSTCPANPWRIGRLSQTGAGASHRSPSRGSNGGSTLCRCDRHSRVSRSSIIPERSGWSCSQGHAPCWLQKARSPVRDLHEFPLLDKLGWVPIDESIGKPARQTDRSIRCATGNAPAPDVMLHRQIPPLRCGLQGHTRPARYQQVLLSISGAPIDSSESPFSQKNSRQFAARPHALNPSDIQARLGSISKQRRVVTSLHEGTRRRIRQ